MDLARRIYSRDLKIAAMREIDGGRPIGEVARHLELSPHLLERWRSEWRARGDLAFPGIMAAEFSYFTGLAGSVMALLTPDLWSPWPSYPAIYFFLAHGGIVVGCSILVFGGIVAVRPGAIRRTFGVLVLYATPLGISDELTGANYMYLCQRPAIPSLLDVLGPWPVYLAGAAVVALGLFCLLSIPARRARTGISEA